MNINYFMNEAIKEAKLAFDSNEVPIGGILVDSKTNEIIERSYNKINIKKNAIFHCEIDLIINSCAKLSQKYLNNTVMFVTLEPCTMCASAIREVHINKLYFGAYDEKKGSLESIMKIYNKNHHYVPEVYGGIREKECSLLLKNFFHKLRS